VGQGQEMLIRAALEQEKPLVLDADGLNNLARIDNWPGLRRCPLVLTPHPGELARLTGTRSYVNETGNPGMATGGTGDVLTGLVAGLAMQGLDLFTAASLATYTHGLAGDLAAAAGTEEAAIATDLLDHIPQAMQKIVD